MYNSVELKINNVECKIMYNERSMMQNVKYCKIKDK